MGKSAGMMGVFAAAPDWFWQDAGLTVLAAVAAGLLFAVWSRTRASRR